MKCKNCGANYSSRELFCPYCNTPNRVGQLREMQRERAQLDYDTAAEETVPQLRKKMCNRVFNRVLLIEAVLLVLYFAGVFLTFFVQDSWLQLKKKTHHAEMLTTMETMYAEQRFAELYFYMQENDLIGYGNQEYRAYTEISFLDYDYRRFLEARMRFYQEQDELQPYTVSNVLQAINGLLFQRETDLTEQNAALYAEYVREASVFARSVLGLTDQQLQLLSQDYLFVSDAEQLTSAILEGRQSHVP